MKTLKLTLVTLLAVAMVFSCKKDENPLENLLPGGPVDNGCKITKLIIDEGVGKNYTNKYEYSDAGVLVKINKMNTGSNSINGYDTLMYNSSGELVKIKGMSSDGMYAYDSVMYTYVGGKVVTIVKGGTKNSTPYVETTAITYLLNQVLTVTTTGGDGMAFKDIVYDNGNISTLKFKMGVSGDWIDMKVSSYDQNQNVYRKMIPDWESIVFGSCTNNMMVLEFNQDATIDGNAVKIGDKAISRTYMANSDKMVTSISHGVTVFQQEAKVDAIEWMCP